MYQENIVICAMKHIEFEVKKIDSSSYTISTGYMALEK